MRTRRVSNNRDAQHWSGGPEHADGLQLCARFWGDMLWIAAGRHEESNVQQVPECTTQSICWSG